MARQPTILRLSPQQGSDLNEFIRQMRQAGRLKEGRRGRAIWWSAFGRKTVNWIAKELHLSRRTIWTYFNIYRQRGLTGLQGKYRLPR